MRSVRPSTRKISNRYFYGLRIGGLLIAALPLINGCSNGGDSDPPTQPPPEQTETVGLDGRPDNSTCLAPANPGTVNDVDLVDPFPNLTVSGFPLGLHQLPNNDQFFYLMFRRGEIIRFANNSTVADATTVLDISGKVDFLNSEGGLLGMAFDPNVASNRAVYLSYTTSGGGAAGQSIIARYYLSEDFGTIDPDSERVVLSLDQPFGNHNGGNIAFGPDGYLYVGFGDGGSGNDPNGHGQNTMTLLGAMLRIDVDPVANSEPFYSIPGDNPFVDGGGLPEIYAYGLRNPFRWSFDRVTGVLWAGDVGERDREEVDHIVNGGNYGWADMEGGICRIDDCSDFVAPVHDYGRDVGTTVTGGYVYRGSAFAELQGLYVFGDFGSRSIWTLAANGDSYERTQVAVAPGSPGSFAQDNAGELYVLSPGSEPLLKIAPLTSSTTPSNIPTQLSATGCFDPANPSEPATGLIPYSVVTPLWSDGAVKDRWMALPNGETIELDNNGDFLFPVGTVLAKHFRANNTLIETRLFMHHASGWAGYSYRWNAAQSDAQLLDGAVDDNVAGLDWHFPSGNECLLCHTAVKNFALGPEVAQLNHDFTYPSTGRTDNQINTLDGIALFEMSPSQDLLDQTHFAIDDSDATLEQRAKSYLHANCAQCHQPGGTGGGNMDLRFATPLAEMNICDVPPTDDLGIANARLFAPGNALASIIVERMQRTDTIRMPPLASNVVDTEAVMEISDWINSVGLCP